MLYLLTVIIGKALSLYCDPAGCISCSSGVLYRNNFCITQCPYPELPNKNPCNNFIYNDLFILPFYTFNNISQTTFKIFQTPSLVPFSDPSRTTPMPTPSQGFYFDVNSSFLTSTSLVLAPDFTFFVSGLFKAPGTLFSLK